MHKLTAALKRLEKWLGKHRKHYLKGLLPGATPAQLTALEKALGRPLPEELRIWLGWHNGQDPDLVGAFIESWLLMSSEEIAEEWKQRYTHSDPPWNSAWIPFLDDGEGDLVCLDSTQPVCPVREIWRGHKEPEVVAPSLTEWVETFTSDVEAGNYEEDPERGEFQKK